MMPFLSEQFLAGLLMAIAVFGGIYASSIFRNLAAASFAATVCVAFFKFGGVTGVTLLIRATKFELLSKPLFAQGLVAGAIVIIAIALALRNRHQT